MNLKNLLPAALAGALGLSATSCDPAEALQKKHQKDIEDVMQMVQPSDANLATSEAYYAGRSDLVSISPEQRASLALSHAKLACAKEGLEKGTLSFADFYNTIIASKSPIITDKNTKLQIDDSFGYTSSISVGPQTIEFWTAPGNPNTIFKNYSVSNVEMQWGELTITITGESYHTKQTDNHHKAEWDADLSPADTPTKDSCTFSVSLVLAK